MIDSEGRKEFRKKIKELQDAFLTLVKKQAILEKQLINKPVTTTNEEPKERLYKQVNFQNDEELLKQFSCGNCWIEESFAHSAEFGCEECGNDQKHYKRIQYIKV